MDQLRSCTTAPIIIHNTTIRRKSSTLAIILSLILVCSRRSNIGISRQCWAARALQIQHQQLQRSRHPRRFCYPGRSFRELPARLHFSASASTESDVDKDKEAEEEEQLARRRWEQMYQQGGSGRDSGSGEFNSMMSSACEIRVVTFDLDNTLWNTSATIDAANAALAKHMNENLPVDGNNNTNSVVRVESVMGKLYAADKARYCPIELDQAKSPVLLTLLRKDAIRHVVSEHGKHQNNNNGEAATNEFVDTAFAVWTKARHEAIPLHLAESATASLHLVQSLQRCAAQGGSRGGGGGRVVIGAITDGNSNPMAIPELAGYFDFCINAEMVGISKPDKRVYLHAVARAMEHPFLQDLMPPTLLSTENRVLTDDQLEELVGPWWVHIGDDFVKDIVAAKNLNMRSIWARELVLDKLVDPTTTALSPKKERTVEELVQFIAEMKVVEMQVGADNYLADSLQKEFADAIADEFRSVAGILQQWQQEALIASRSGRNETPQETKPTPPVYEDDTPSAVSSGDSELNPNSQQEKKFCISCGTKLPRVAKFCSSCGEKQ